MALLLRLLADIAAKADIGSMTDLAHCREISCWRTVVVPDATTVCRDGETSYDMIKVMMVLTVGWQGCIVMPRTSGCHIFVLSVTLCIFCMWYMVNWLIMTWLQIIFVSCVSLSTNLWNYSCFCLCLRQRYFNDSLSGTLQDLPSTLQLSLYKSTTEWIYWLRWLSLLQSI